MLTEVSSWKVTVYRKAKMLRIEVEYGGRRESPLLWYMSEQSLTPLFF